MSSDWERYRGPADSLLDAIGRTPLVRLARVAPDVELFAKIEWYGPTGSVKDRIYARMLTEAERRVATLIGSGQTNKSAAAQLGVSVNTVGTHLRAVFGKLGIQSRVQLANELHKKELT